MKYDEEKLLSCRYKIRYIYSLRNHEEITQILYFNKARYLGTNLILIANFTLMTNS